MLFDLFSINQISFAPESHMEVFCCLSVIMLIAWFSNLFCWSRSPVWFPGDGGDYPWGGYKYLKYFLAGKNNPGRRYIQCKQLRILNLKFMHYFFVNAPLYPTSSLTACKPPFFTGSRQKWLRTCFTCVQVVPHFGKETTQMSESLTLKLLILSRWLR